MNLIPGYTPPASIHFPLHVTSGKVSPIWGQRMACRCVYNLEGNCIFRKVFVAKQHIRMNHPIF